MYKEHSLHKANYIDMFSTKSAGAYLIQYDSLNHIFCTNILDLKGLLWKYKLGSNGIFQVS